jgi:hypothetical protein
MTYIRFVRSYKERVGSVYSKWTALRHSALVICKWPIYKSELSHSGREDTHSPVRNGASLEQSLWVVIIDFNFNRSANRYNHPIQNPLLFATGTPDTWYFGVRSDYDRKYVAIYIIQRTTRNCQIYSESMGMTSGACTHFDNNQEIYWWVIPFEISAAIHFPSTSQTAYLPNIHTTNTLTSQYIRKWMIRWIN